VPLTADGTRNVVLKEPLPVVWTAGMPAGFPSQVNWTSVRPPKPEPLAPTVAFVTALAGESPSAAAEDVDASVTPAPVAAAMSAQIVSTRSPPTAHSATRSPLEEPAECLGTVRVGTAAAHGLLPRRDEPPADMCSLHSVARPAR
jgi:hypothetical protein